VIACVRTHLSADRKSTLRTKKLLPGDNLAIESHYMIVEQQLPMISFFSFLLALVSFDSN
jgi:hypothetical protein